MGQRHAQGVLAVQEIEKLTIIDINADALVTAKNNLAAVNNTSKAIYTLSNDFFSAKQEIDVVIMASTAGNRVEDCKKVIQMNPKAILLEKPLGQSLKEVQEIIELFKEHKTIKTFVNLNMRIYPSFLKLKEDIETLQQFKGVAEITINTGTIGIGANGIHYIDLMRFLFEADTIEVISASIDEQIIPSGRGPQFCDFGGWCVMEYKKDGKVKARVIFNLSAGSTVFGTMNFTFPHARVIVDEFEQKRYNKYRKEDSEMPIQRYAADYMPQSEEQFVSPDLKNLTESWLSNFIKGKMSLPFLEEAMESHKAMFDWLSKSKTHKGVYPVT